MFGGGGGGKFFLERSTEDRVVTSAPVPRQYKRVTSGNPNATASDRRSRQRGSLLSASQAVSEAVRGEAPWRSRNAGGAMELRGGGRR